VKRQIAIACIVLSVVVTGSSRGGQPVSPEAHRAAPALAFDPTRDLAAWQAELRGRLSELLALPARRDTAIRATLRREAQTDRYRLDRIELEVEPGQTMPGYLLVPTSGKPPFPVMICLQGHSPGVHISIGRAGTDADRRAIEGGRDLALQAVAHGWAAVAIEQRGFGRRAVPGVACNELALRELLAGRPLLGQRVADVQRTIDFIATRPELDASRIGCMGNSTGGTVSFYAACVDPRIRVAVVSCSFGTFESTWLHAKHCACGYVPGILKWADMPDLAGLVAPRYLILVAGRQDPLARFDGVQQGYARARRIFTAAGCPGHVALLAADGSHRFYPELAWPAVEKALAETKQNPQD